MKGKQILFAGVLGCLAWGLVPQARGQADADELDREFKTEYKYAERLLSREFGMPDLAVLQIDRMKAKFRSQRHSAMIEALEINGLVSSGKFAEAQAIIAKQPDKESFNTWRMHMAVADGFYAFSRFDEFFKIHQDFMKAFPTAPAGEEEEYLNLCFRFTGLLALQKRYALEAVAAYKHLLEQRMPDPYYIRATRAAMITHILKIADEMEDGKDRMDLLTYADKENNNQFWVQDALYGQAIVAKAHIMKLMGDTAGAQEMLDTYLPRLLDIHRQLVQQAEEEKNPSLLRESPMPQCRFLIASMLWKQVQQLARKEPRAKADDDAILDLLLGPREKANGPRKRNGAFDHFVNVFAQYPESQWAMDAVDESEKIGAFIEERFGQKINIPINEEVRQKIRVSHFVDAKTAQQEQQYKKAVELFESFLHRYAESREGVSAHSQLAQIYAELYQDTDDAAEREWYDMLIDMLAGNLAERFANLPWRGEAAAEIRALAEQMTVLGLGHKRETFYNLFFKNYPNDGTTPGHIFKFAEKAFQEEDLATALRYFSMLESYTGNPAYPDVLMRLSTLAGRQGDNKKKMEYLDKAVAAHEARGDRRNELTYAGTLLVRANEMRQVAFANYYSTNTAERAESIKGLAQSAMFFDDAAKKLRESIRKLPNDTSLQAQLENAIFLKAYTLEFINDPPEKLEQFRKSAIATYEQFIKDYPKAQFAPRALVQIGTLQTTLGDSAAAERAFARLQKDYPDSDSARDAVPLFADALMKLGFSEEAVVQYRKMFAETGKYTPQQYLAAGTALLAARDYTLALDAFDLAIKQPKADAAVVMEATYGRGRAFFNLKRYAEALTALTEFEQKYGRYERIIDVWFLMIETHSLLGETEKDHQKRGASFGRAVPIFRKIRDHLKDEVGSARIDLAAASLLVRRMNAEEKMGLKEQAQETRGKAAGAFLAMMSIPPGKDNLAFFLHEAYKEGIPLFLAFGAPDIAREQCEKYLANFPEGKYAPQVRVWLNQANAATK